MNNIKLPFFTIGQGQPLTVFSGPCVIEDEALAFETCLFLKELFHSLGIQFVYKSSYDKANRSSYSSFRGPGLKEGLRILEKVKIHFNVPIITDIHTPEEAREAAKVCDILQIPAFLCRQTDLIEAAAATGAVINVKKGQFMAPWDMENVVEKIKHMGNNQIILTDRGTTFGYNNLVSDMRSIPIMQQFGTPVCFDASHSVQLPGGNKQSSGGQREFIPTLAKAAIAAGCNCLFMESHPRPNLAKSDKDSVMPFDQMRELFTKLKQIYDIVQN